MVRYRNPDEESTWRKAAEEPTARPVRNTRVIIPPTLEQMLAFENKTHRSRESDIRAVFGMSMTSYQQYLNRAIDTPEALAADPILVKRLLNQRHRAMADRAARRFRPNGGRV